MSLPSEVDQDEAAAWLEAGRLAELGLNAATLVHEVRQPLFAIKALAQMMQADATVDPSARLQELLRQVDLLENLIQRYDGSGPSPESQMLPVSLVEIVRESVTSLEALARREGKSLRVEASRRELVLADRVSVHQITVNLVRNAIDAARSSVLVVVEGSVLSVHDDGEGIAESVRGRIFDLFVTTKPTGKGTGLGLAVTRRLVQAMAGSLDFKTSHKGTVFVARFPPADEAGRG